jgi:hypothetical protein
MPRQLSMPDYYALLIITVLYRYKKPGAFVSWWFKSYTFARSRAPWGSKNGVGATTAGT